MPAMSVSSLPPLLSLQQSGSIQPLGPFRLHVVLKQGRDLAAKDSCGKQMLCKSLDCQRSLITIGVCKMIFWEQLLST